MSNIIYFYYVEGECEKHLIENIKGKYLLPGKIKKININQKRISDMFLRELSRNTKIILVFDTDVINREILLYNICKLRRSKVIKDIILIPQIQNLEDEILFSTNLRNIKDFTKSSTDSDFKKDFLTITNLVNKLEMYNFNLNKFWSRNYCDNSRQVEFENNSSKIKINI